MKKFYRIFLLSIFMILTIFSVVFAEDKLVLTQKYTLKNTSSTAKKDATIKVFIGQKDVVKYQKDGEIKIMPSPTDTEEDRYGNVYAIFDVSQYKPGRSITINIERDYETSDFEQEIAKRSEATINDDNSLYIEPQEKVQSDDSEIIAKAKEITYALSSDYKRALAIYDFVNTKVNYDKSTNFANKGALSALVNKRGTCEEYATLFAALCRSVGIPCKILMGYKVEGVVTKESETLLNPETGLYYDTEAEFGYKITPYVWNEFWLDDYGWLPVDSSILYSKDGKREVNLETFCKIKGADYLAVGIYTGDLNVLEYSSSFTNTDYVENVSKYKTFAKTKHEFHDLNGYEWAEDSINTLYDMNVIKGYTEDEYGPAANVTRIEFVCLLARILKQLNYMPSTRGNIYYYMDYDKNHYSKQEYDFLMRCLEEVKPYDSKFAVGYGAMDEIFGSRLEANKAITREEVVALMDSFLRYPADGSAKFSDMYSSKFVNSISKAYTNGLINGYNDGTFRPKKSITRAEIAVILDRYVGVKDYVL